MKKILSLVLALFSFSAICSSWYWGFKPAYNISEIQKNNVIFSRTNYIVVSELTANGIPKSDWKNNDYFNTKAFVKNLNPCASDIYTVANDLSSLTNWNIFETDFFYNGTLLGHTSGRESYTGGTLRVYNCSSNWNDINNNAFVASGLQLASKTNSNIYSLYLISFDPKYVYFHLKSSRVTTPSDEISINNNYTGYTNGYFQYSIERIQYQAPTNEDKYKKNIKVIVSKVKFDKNTGAFYSTSQTNNWLNQSAWAMEEWIELGDYDTYETRIEILLYNPNKPNTISGGRILRWFR